MLTAERLRELLDCNPKTGSCRWRATRGSAKAGSEAGQTRSDGYRSISIDGKRYYRHRIIWFFVHDEWPSGDIDHIDNVSGHDWIDNLRPATREQNLANMRLHAKNTSGFKGVSWHKWRCKWRASISRNNKHSHLGFFDTPEAAAAAYRAAALKAHGEFARF